MRINHPVTRHGLRFAEYRSPSNVPPACRHLFGTYFGEESISSVGGGRNFRSTFQSIFGKVGRMLF